MMHGDEKSDPFVVAMKPANEGGRLPEELVEPRGGAEGNAIEPGMRRTPIRESMSHGLDRGSLPPGSYGGFLVKRIVSDGTSFSGLSVGHIRRCVHHAGRPPWVRPVGLQARIRWNSLFRTMLPHSRGRRGLEGGTNLDGGISQP